MGDDPLAGIEPGEPLAEATEHRLRQGIAGSTRPAQITALRVDSAAEVETS